mmetsp:Transcript_18988/g.53084  ORF Transcript_18988/g.53084 Transcript_18988/m.53084 type:complete len:281 (+) Transcript_18988:314-1156(+)
MLGLRSGLGDPLRGVLGRLHKGLALPGQLETVIIPIQGTRTLHDSPSGSAIRSLLPFLERRAALDHHHRVRGHHVHQRRLRIWAQRSEEIRHRPSGPLRVVEEVVDSDGTTLGEQRPHLHEGVVHGVVQVRVQVHKREGLERFRDLHVFEEAFQRRQVVVDVEPLLITQEVRIVVLPTARAVVALQKIRIVLAGVGRRQALERIDSQELPAISLGNPGEEHRCAALANAKLGEVARHPRQHVVHHEVVVDHLAPRIRWHHAVVPDVSQLVVQLLRKHPLL